MAICLSALLAGCANTVDWSQVGTSPAQQAENRADVLACDARSTATTARTKPAAQVGTAQWRSTIRIQMRTFEECMVSKGWLKMPVIGWQKTRPATGLSNESGGGD